LNSINAFVQVLSEPIQGVIDNISALPVPPIKVSLSAPPSSRSLPDPPGQFVCVGIAYQLIIESIAGPVQFSDPIVDSEIQTVR